MFYVYIIESIATGRWYYGYSGGNPLERLKVHNCSHHHYTANKGPGELVFERKTSELLLGYHSRVTCVLLIAKTF